MSATLAPRLVLVTRPTELQGLIARHGTKNQAAFFLHSRGQDIEEAVHHAQLFDRGLAALLASVPTDWRSARVDRADLDRFLFDPGDIVVALGQDGLVANLAKYLNGQPVLGFDPEPGQNAGALVFFDPTDAKELFLSTVEGEARIQERSMVEAQVGTGSRVLALSEIFVGHASHQSARYELHWNGKSESQSSSGVIVSTGTGATGWTASIERERHTGLELPSPTDSTLAFLVREAWPAARFGVSMTAGMLEPGQRLRIVSHMEQGVVFGDGMESDRVSLAWGQPLEIGIAKERLRLVTG